MTLWGSKRVATIKSTRVSCVSGVYVCVCVYIYVYVLTVITGTQRDVSPKEAILQTEGTCQMLYADITNAV